ncbi:hypothetical protein D9M72_453320 [compost metagenome]
MELMARGRFFSGSLVSAAAVPTSSMPAKAKMAIWKPRMKPNMPCGNMPPSFQMLARLATAPLGEVKCVAIMTMPVPISARMATTLMIANQNSASPKALTVGRFSRISTTGVIRAGIHSGVPGASLSTYPAIATMSATPVTTQKNQ